MSQQKITREIPWSRPRIALTSFTGGSEDAPAGQVPTSIGSNGQVAWGSNVGTITVNGTTLVRGPYINIANGSNTTVTVDMVGAVASNTIRVHATGGAASFGSNSNQVSYANAPGASSDSSRADHVHLGVTSVSHASNTYSGPVILAPGANVGITSPTAGTFTIHSSASGGGGSSSLTVADEGSPLATAATTLDFVGAGVTASGTGATKTITIPGGSSAADPVQEHFGTPDSAFEFTSSSLAGLTAMGSPDAENADTSYDGAYYVADNASGLAWCGRYISGSAPFTAITRVLDSNMKANFSAVALYVAEATPGKMSTVDVGTKTRTVGVNIFSSPTSYSSTAASDIINQVSFPCWLGVVATSTSNVAYYFSHDGRVWTIILTGHNPSMTIGSVGFAAKSENSVGHAAVFDYFRVWNSAKTFLTGA